MNALAEVAFGSDPGRWPLPTAASPTDRWLRAVAAGGQGRYAAALSDLDQIGRNRADPELTSLAHSTRASFLRQLGGHVAARGWDGRARLAARTDGPAAADALIGLAADALGVGRFSLSGRLLQRAGQLLDRGSPDRPAIRWAWVRAELAMATGHGADAVLRAEEAVERAAGWTSTRHLVKSRVVFAAALCSAGHHEAARRTADAALRDADQAGLVPLSWALCCLLADIGSADLAPADVLDHRDRAADRIRRQGGGWAKNPVEGGVWPPGESRGFH